jgi:hypothetical protein
MQTDTSSGDIFGLGIDAHSKDLLKTSAMWAKIIAIISFVSAGISVLTAVIKSTSASENVFGGIGAIAGSMMVAALTVTLNLFLFRFASNISDSLTNMNQQQFNSGASNLRVYFKFLGILMIIFMSLFLLGMLFFVMGLGLSR